MGGGGLRLGLEKVFYSLVFETQNDEQYRRRRINLDLYLREDEKLLLYKMEVLNYLVYAVVVLSCWKFC